MAKISPMMAQYKQTKAEYPDVILFYRLGDFYEMFYDDACLASQELDLTLTSRSAGEEGKVPMCGVPYHAADTYISKLIAKGYRVAICEQMEDPKATKGLVNRDVVRIISPGTVVEDTILSEQRHSYLAAVCGDKNKYGFAYADISTGEFMTTEFVDANSAFSSIINEIIRIQPNEILLGKSLITDVEKVNLIRNATTAMLSQVDDMDFSTENSEKILCSHFQIEDTSELFLPPLAKRAAAGMLFFLNRTQKRSLSYISKIKFYENISFMTLDNSVRRNLELNTTLFSGKTRGSLLWVMDKTSGVMGKRLLREWLNNPLLDLQQIIDRQEAVGELLSKPMIMSELKEFLSEIHDLERISSRIAYGSGTPRDMADLRDSIQCLPDFTKILFSLESPIFKNMAAEFDDLHYLWATLTTTLAEEDEQHRLPTSVKEGGIIKDGYDSEIDELRALANGGVQMVRDIEAKEREKTGIKSLKVGYSRVFGYYIDVTNTYKNQVPDYYIRKQTLANSERYFTVELKEYEEKILGATDRLNEKEYAIFCSLRDYITANTAQIQLTASFIAIADVLLSFAIVAQENRYCRPLVDDGDVINIEGGRHPMVEKINDNVFIENDALLDGNENHIIVITGPNMAGKSTYMRQVALIVLMAQIGSFVPAKSAHIGIVDRIFTRIGSSDDLIGGSSTFMVEMKETAEILNNATSRSLVILDEIGRGTSTYDGLSIAWACIDFLADGENSPKTLFATHYHELTEIEDEKSCLKNYEIAVEEVNGELIFLRKIKRGRANKSYGIQVARLAGLPVRVINQAKKILRALEKNNLHDQGNDPEIEIEEPSLFKELTPEQEEVIQQIENLDLDNMRPLQAFGLMAEWQDLLKHGK